MEEILVPAGQGIKTRNAGQMRVESGRKMKIREHREGKDLTLFLKGNLDEASSPGIEKKLDLILMKDTDIKNIHLDLSDVRYLASAGIRTLIILYKKAIKKDKKILIGNMSGAAREVLEMVGILSLFAGAGR